MENRRAPWRIAIADDSPAFLAAAAGYIGSLPGCVLAGTAGGGPPGRGVGGGGGAALELVEAVTPDLLLLDLGIAPARGLDMVRRVKASPAAPAIVALALFYSDEAAAQADRAGAAALLGKEAFVTGLGELLARLLPVA